MGNWLLPSHLPLRFEHVGRASAWTQQHVLPGLKCPHMSVSTVEVGWPDERLIVLIFLEGEVECVFEHDFADHNYVDLCKYCGIGGRVSADAAVTLPSRAAGL